MIVSGTKFTGQLFKAAISKYMAHRREKKLEKQRSRDAPVTPKGKQTVKQLIGQNQGVSNIEINDPSIKDFERIARKYGVDYAVKKDRSASPPKYLIFFKGRDADALTAAFTEYTGKKSQKGGENRAPVRAGEAGPVQRAAQKYRGGPQPPEGAGTMKQVNVKKLVLLNLPYFLLGLFATNLGGSLAAGDRRGCVCQDALVLLHLAGGAGKLVAQPAPAGFAGWGFAAALACGWRCI